MSLKPWDEGYVAPYADPSDPRDHAHLGGKKTIQKYRDAGMNCPKDGPLPEKTQYRQTLEDKTKETLHPAVMAKYDRFLAEYMHDFNAQKAWVRSGGTENSPSRPYEILRTGYAQAKLRKLLDELDEESLVSNKDIIMGIKSEACNFAENSSPSARVNAWKLLAQLRGMLVKKVENTVQHSGGVMLIPAQPKDVTTWEHDASDSQAKLSEDVRK